MLVRKACAFNSLLVALQSKPFLFDKQTPVPLCILHLEDSDQDHLLVKRELSRLNDPMEILRVETLAGFAQALDERFFSVILADYKLAGFTALDAWQVVVDKKKRIPFILLSGAIGELEQAPARYPAHHRSA